MTRTQKILALALATQLLLLLLLWSPWTAGSTPTAKSVLLPELASFEPSAIEIEGEQSTLRLDREGQTWRIEAAGGYPADAAKVDKLLADLKQVEVRRPVVSGARYHAALHVTAEEHERKLRLSGASGEPSVELFVGTSPNYGINHVRRSDRDEVYEVKGLSPWDMRPEPSSWIETRLVDVEPDRVRAITVSNGHGAFELRRGDDGAFTLASGGSPGAALDHAAVDGFVGSLTGLRMSEPAGRAEGGADYGLASPAGRVSLVYDADGAPKTFELAIGGAAEGGDKRYARVGGSEFAVLLGKWDAERVLDKKLSDLLVAKGQ